MYSAACLATYWRDSSGKINITVSNAMFNVVYSSNLAAYIWDKYRMGPGSEIHVLPVRHTCFLSRSTFFSLPHALTDGLFFGWFDGPLTVVRLTEVE